MGRSKGFRFGSMVVSTGPWRGKRDEYHSHVDILSAGDVVLVEHGVLGGSAVEPTWALGLDQYAYGV